MVVEFNRKTIISFPNNSSLEDIETGIMDGSLFVDEVMFTDRFTIGECHANRFEVDVTDYDQVDKGEKIYVYQVVTENNTETNVPIFTGYVDSCVTNRGRFEDSKHIVAYDALYAKSTVDVAKWWEEEYDTVIRHTVKELRDSLCAYVGIPFENVSLPNDDVQIAQTQQIYNISFQSMLTYLLQINAANGYVGRDGVLRFPVISSKQPIAIDDTYAQNTSDFDTYTVPAFESVEITNTTEGTVALVGSESNILHITDNMLLLNKEYTELCEIAEVILSRVNTIMYRPAQIDMIYSNLEIMAGDRVKIGQNIYLVCEVTLSGTQLVDQHIASTGAGEIDEASPDYDATRRDMQDQISASSLKYYTHQNLEAIEINANINRPIIQIKYTTSADTLIAFHGCVIIDVELVDSSQPGIVELSYETSRAVVPNYHPTETYYEDGRHTIPLLHFWEAMANKRDTFRVYLQPQNCKVTIGAFRLEAYMEGMGILGKDIWDGVIEGEDNITEVTIFATTPSAVDTIGDDVDVEVTDSIRLSFTDEVEVYNLDTTPKPRPFTASMYLNKYPLHDLTWAEVSQMTWGEVLNGFLW